MLMEIKNNGKRRIRVVNNIFIQPGKTMDVDDEIGSILVKKHADITSKVKYKPKPIYKPKKKEIIKKEDDVDDIE